MNAEESRSTFDVNLFWMTTACGIAGAFIPVLVKMVLQVLSRETEMECNLRRQACDLKAELGSISMVDEFAKYAKIQRKVNKVTNELSLKADVRSSYALKVRIVSTGILYAVMALTTSFLIWNYRYTPVAVLPEKWLFPVATLLAYPSGVSGGISLTAWLFICVTVCRFFTSFLKF